MEKVFYKGLDMLKPNVHFPSKMPRTAAIPIVRDPKTGYLNAGVYSAGVANLNPYSVLFGPKSAPAIEMFKQVEEFTVALPSRDQVDAMWIIALQVPHGIDEVDMVGWHSLAPQAISTPGIEECPINLECKKIFSQALPPPWRTIVIGEVVGVHIDRSLLNMSRSEVSSQVPMHEFGVNPDTGIYSLSVLNGELQPPAQPGKTWEGQSSKDKKVYVSGQDLYCPENDRILMNVVFPRPTYILMTMDERDCHYAEPLAIGSLQSTEPAVQITVKKDSPGYKNIQGSREFVVSVPDRSRVQKFEALEKCAPDFEAAGYTLLPPNAVKVQGLAECLVSMECKVEMFADVPGTDYAIVVGRRVGVSLDPETVKGLDPQVHSLHDRMGFLNSHYSRFLYSVFDRGMERKWGSQDPHHMCPVRPLPSWGNRYTGGWWGTGSGPLHYWMIELCQEGLLSKEEYHKVMFDVGLWNNGQLIPHLAEYFDVELKNCIRERLTMLLGKMAWAHRDMAKWDEIHEYLRTIPEPSRSYFSGPTYYDKWYDDKI